VINSLGNFTSIPRKGATANGKKGWNGTFDKFL